MIKMNKIEDKMNNKNSIEDKMNNKNSVEDKMNNMNSVEEIEIGMKIMIIKDGEYQDSGLVIDVLQNEIVLQDRDECFSYDFSEIDSFLQLRHA